MKVFFESAVNSKDLKCLFQAEKQKEVERRLRATEVEEKERLAKERLELFEKRREKERLIKSLQRKKAIIQYVIFQNQIIRRRHICSIESLFVYDRCDI